MYFFFYVSLEKVKLALDILRTDFRINEYKIHYILRYTVSYFEENYNSSYWKTCKNEV